MRPKFFFPFTALSVLSCFLILACFSCFSSAQETGEEVDRYSAGVLFSVPANQEGEPGDFVTYVFRIENHTGIHKSFTASVASTQNWLLLTDKNRIDLPPYSKDIFAFSVMIPPSAPGGTEDLLKVVFSGADLTTSYMLTTKVKIIKKFTFQVVDKISGAPGEALKIPVHISNSGSVSEDFSLRVESEKKWPATWESSSFSLASGEKMSTFIHCHIPASALRGSAETLHLKVKTTGDLQEYQTTVVVSEKTTAALERQLSIPLHSYFSLTFPALEKQALIPWEADLRLTGDIHDGLWLNLYLSGEEKEDEPAGPSTFFLGLTGNDRLLRAGKFSAGWNGLISSPTSTAMLYYQDYRNYPRQFWIGSQYEDIFAPSWLGGTFNIPEKNMDLRVLFPFAEEKGDETEKTARFTGSLEAQAPYPPFLSQHLPPGWNGSLTGALGMGEENLLWQGELSLQRRNPADIFSFSFSAGDEFYHNIENTTRFTALTLSLENLLTDRLSLEHLMDLRLTFDYDNKPFLAPTLQNKVSFDHYYMLFRASHKQVKAAGEMEIGARQNWRSWQGTAALNYERGFLPVSTNTLNFSGKIRRRFFGASYVEGFLNHQWLWKDAEYNTSFSTGIRWNYPLFSSLDTYGGLIYSKSGQYYDTSFYSLLSYWISPKDRLQLGVRSPLENSDSFDISNQELTLQLSFQRRDAFLVSVPWGSIEGKVFLDLNRNRRYDRGEPGVPGVAVLLNGEEKTITGADGVWVIPRVPGGRQQITLACAKDEFFLPDAEWEVEVTSNRQSVLTVPAFSPLEIKGFIFLDEKGNRQPDPTDPPLGEVELLLYTEANAEAIARTISGDDGFFSFSGLFPGEYLIEVNRQTLPASAAEPSSLPVTIEDYSPPLITFPAPAKEKEIEFTFIQE